MKRNLKKRWKILRELWLPFTASKVSGHAAAASFYILLSVLPAAALSLTFLSFLPVPKSYWTQLLEELLPAHFHPFAEYLLSAISPRHPAALLSVWSLLALWSASKGILSMSDGISTILSNHRPDGFLRRRLNAMLSFALLAAILLLTLSVHVFGQWLLFQLSLRSPETAGIFSLFYRFRHLYSLLILSVLLSFLYWLLPGRALTFRYSFFNGSLSAVGWMIVSAIFSIYVNHFQSYQRLYGSLGLLLLIGLWLHICISMLLYSVLLVNLVIKKEYHPFKIIKRAISKM